MTNGEGAGAEIGMLHVNNLSRRTEKRRPLIDDAFRRVADSGWFVLGAEVRAFENSFAAYLAARHCVAVANGTDALRLALQAAGVTADDAVATAANAGMYATTALRTIGAKPFFLDVDAATHGITAAEVARAADAGVKAVVATHLYGLALPEIADIARHCRARGIALIEDCAQAHGAMVDGQYVGTFGDAASFSFYPTKNLGALGDGGAVVTNDDGLADKVRKLRQYGWTAKYTVAVSGAGNSRLDELQAAILTGFLPHLDADNARRRAIAARYSASIKADIMLPPQGDRAYVAHLYVVRTAKREQLRSYLETHHIGSDIHYPIPDHRQPLFGTAFAAIHLPVTEMLATEVLTLPCYPEMTDPEVQSVITAVNGWPS